MIANNNNDGNKDGSHGAHSLLIQQMELPGVH